MTGLGRAVRGLASDRAGSTLIEFAFAASVLIVLIVGVLEFGRVLLLQTQLQQAVAQAARCATVLTNSTCNSSSAIKSYAAGQASTIVSISANNFVYTNAACGNQVTASYPFSFIIPFYGTVSMTLNAKACTPK